MIIRPMTIISITITMMLLLLIIDYHLYHHHFLSMHTFYNLPHQGISQYPHTTLGVVVKHQGP